jgi:hypothetical protein
MSVYLLIIAVYKEWLLRTHLISTDQMVVGLMSPSGLPYIWTGHLKPLRIDKGVCK